MKRTTAVNRKRAKVVSSSNYRNSLLRNVRHFMKESVLHTNLDRIHSVTQFSSWGSYNVLSCLLSATRCSLCHCAYVTARHWHFHAYCIMGLPHGCFWEFHGDLMYGNGTSSANPEHNNEPEQWFGTLLGIGSLYNVIQPGPIGSWTQGPCLWKDTFPDE